MEHYERIMHISIIQPKPRHFIALVIFVVLLFIVACLSAKNSDAYEEVNRFIMNDEDVAATIGTIKNTNFEFWRGFQYRTNGIADFYIKASGNRGIFMIHVGLCGYAGAWRVMSIDIHNSNYILLRRIDYNNACQSASSCRG